MDLQKRGMLFPIFLLYVTSYVSAKFCDKNQFWSTFLERCENCSRCVHPEIVIRPCQRHKDTVCGRLSELNLDWSFLKHPDSGVKNTNSQKEMVQTFRENLEGIRQHEKHVREKQRYLHERQKQMKDSAEDYNEIEDGERQANKKILLEKLRELGRWSWHYSDDPMGKKEREKVMKLLETLLDLPVVLDSFPNKKILHFDDDEAFELLRGGRKKKKEEKEKSDFEPTPLKYDENGILLKNFGFSHVEDLPEVVKMEKLVDNGKYEQKTTSEKESSDWRLAIAAGLLVTHTVIILMIATYCMKKNGKEIKDYFIADVGEVQTWILPKEKQGKYPSSGIYKPTTEVRTSGGGSKCKYLERIINKNGKKKVNFYVGMKLPSEMKPLTGKYLDMHKPVGEHV